MQSRRWTEAKPSAEIVLHGLGHANDGLANAMSSFQLPDGVGGLDEGIRLPDDRREASSLDQLHQRQQVLPCRLRIQRAKLLTHEEGHEWRPEQPSEEPYGPPAPAASAHEH